MTHLHITSWALALILFIVALVLIKQGKAKPAKIVQMILRLDYLLILYSGGDLLAEGWTLYENYLGEIIVKVIAGILVIAGLEMILAKMSKKQSATVGWIVLLVALIIAIVLGFFRLPLSV